jgi:serine/threonine-protein kinase HipA
MTTSTVKLWGRMIGKLAPDRGQRAARFQYSPEFLTSQLQIAPLKMSLSDGVRAADSN